MTKRYSVILTEEERKERLFGSSRFRVDKISENVIKYNDSC